MNKIILGILVFAIFAVFTVPAAAQNEVYLVPQHGNTTQCNTTIVQIWVNGTDIAGAYINFTYDPACVNVTDVQSANFPRDWDWNSTISGREIIAGTTSDGLNRTGNYLFANLTIHCLSNDCVTGLNFSEGSDLFNQYGILRPATWTEGTFTCLTPIVTSLTITPEAGITSQVSAYNITVNTTGFTSLNITIPAGFRAKTPSGEDSIARADLWWNDSDYPHYGYVTFTANTSEPSNKMDVYADIGGLTATFLGMAVNYTEGATTSIKSPFGSHEERANLTLPTASQAGYLNLSGLPDTLTNVTVSIGDFVQNPDSAGSYTFTAKAEGELTGKSAVVTIEAPSPCYIATATYGTPLDSNIDVLRDFRDDVLMTNPFGEAFVSTYYASSPSIADALRENDGLRTVTRLTLITPLVYLSKFALNGIWLVFILGLVVVPLYRRKDRKKILKSLLVGAGSILVFIATIFLLGFIGYTIPFCAVVGAYMLPFVIPLSVASALGTLLKIYVNVSDNVKTHARDSKM